MARAARVCTAIRFDPVLHEALKETATELGVGLNWLVAKLCEEGLARIDLTNFSLVRSHAKREQLAGSTEPKSGSPDA